MSPHRTAAPAALALATLLAAIFSATAAQAGPGTYTLHDVDAKLPTCARITDKEEGAILIQNTCGQALTLTPVDGTCAGCDPEMTFAPGEIGWYGLAPTLPGAETDATGPRAVRWQQDNGRSGELTANVALIASAIDTAGGCAIHPGVPASGAGLGLFAAAMMMLRRRRAPARARA